MDRDATRILLVEDDSVIAYDIKSLLTELGYEVLDVVATGAEAVDAAAALSPDLVIMDITLEGEMDGIQTAREMQKSGDMPIVYLTAHTDIHTFLAAKKTNPYGYCMKPAGAHEIYSVVE
ncbi:MAG TPA: response regulator, partial [Spirochaetes bacterium]|nr:response regulator [Spirochaetota bacterium]